MEPSDADAVPMEHSDQPSELNFMSGIIVWFSYLGTFGLTDTHLYNTLYDI